jgi:hypothetical protein
VRPSQGIHFSGENYFFCQRLMLVIPETKTVKIVICYSVESHVLIRYHGITPLIDQTLEPVYLKKRSDFYF